MTPRKTDEDPKIKPEARSAMFVDKATLLMKVLIRWIVERFCLSV